MKNLARIHIKNNEYIDILSENIEEENYFFDVITIYYFLKGDKIVLFQDFLGEGIKSFYNITSEILSNSLEISQRYITYGIGYEWNKSCDLIANDKNDDTIGILSKYSLWSTVNKYGYNTWMYIFQEKIYFEISKNYKWHFEEPEEGETFITFKEFMKEYKSFVIVEVKKEMVKEWNESCKRISESMKV